MSGKNERQEDASLNTLQVLSHSSVLDLLRYILRYGCVAADKKVDYKCDGVDTYVRVSSCATCQGHFINARSTCLLSIYFQPTLSARRSV